MNINWLTHPFEELSNLKHSLDVTLKNWSDPQPSTSSSMDWGWKPRMDVCENKDFFKIILELPSFTKDDLDISVNGRFLSIKGQKVEHSNDEWKYVLRERFNGNETYATQFHRAVSLPEGIDGNSIQAKFQNGVLLLLVPKTGGKTTQRINLMGKEEHVNKRNVINAEERERRRRMEENDPKLSRGHWIAGRMGTVIDEERERSRRIREEDTLYRKSSYADLKLVKQLETKERERRIKDTKGESDKKKIALRISRSIKTLGMNPRSTLRKGSHELEKIIHLEERERQARIRDKGRQRQQQALAKKVSNLIKHSGGMARLRHTGFNYSTITKGYNYSTSRNTGKFMKFDRFGQENSSFGGFNINKFSNNNNKSYGTTGNTGGFKSFGKINITTGPTPSFNKFTHNLEEGERARRLRDKKGQHEAKRLAAEISHMIGSAHF